MIERDNNTATRKRRTKKDNNRNGAQPLVLRWLLVALGITAFTIAGCIRIPDQNWTISHRSPLETRRQVEDCNADCLALSASLPVAAPGATLCEPACSTELNSDGFSLVTWNMFKGNKQGWTEDFKRLSQNTDILILQEAYLSSQLKHLLSLQSYHWDMTTTYEYRQIEAGVLTASRINPNFMCTFSEKEPLIRIPKGVLITRYAMSGTDQQLLVANIHGINFTPTHTAFKRQHNRLEAILAEHCGPMIVAGDFNTWSKSRTSHVADMAEHLGLSAVKFDENRSQILSQYVDHVFYRGLENTNAATSVVTTSDHNPLTVEFKLVNAHEEPEA